MDTCIPMFGDCDYFWHKNVFWCVIGFECVLLGNISSSRTHCDFGLVLLAVSIVLTFEMDCSFGAESFNATHFACAMKEFYRNTFGFGKRRHE